MSSIRRRLLWWLMSGLVLALALAGVISYVVARENVRDLFDYQLRKMALTQQHQRHFGPSVPRGEGQGDNEEGFLVQVWRRGGGLQYSSRPAIALPLPKRPGFATRSWQSRGWRSYALFEARRIIQVSQPLGERQEMSAQIAVSNLGPVLGLIPVLLLLVWTVVGVGLKPLTRIAAAVGERHSASLAPLAEEGLPQEIRPLVEALNELFGRLAQALESQRRFVADAAHELRTPLTAVSLQIQLLERAATSARRAAALAQVKGGLSRATHLVQQLLTMARLEPDAPQRSFSPVDLRELAGTVLAEFAQRARDKGVDLGLIGGDAARVEGDPEALRILLGNLIDNALRHTPPTGRVDVVIARRARQRLLEVRDTGCGIPAAERERVFDRFYRRAGSGATGSGLGLAIVKSIAERHGARVLLEEGEGGKGLTVRVGFEAAGRAVTRMG